MAENPPPLDYERHDPGDKPPPSPAGRMFLGGIYGVAFTFFAGFVLTGISNRPRLVHTYPPTPLPSGPFWPGVIAFASLALCSAWGFRYFLFGPRRRHFVAGILLGVALMSLVEGTCFFSS